MNFDIHAHHYLDANTLEQQLAVMHKRLTAASLADDPPIHELREYAHRWTFEKASKQQQVFEETRALAIKHQVEYYQNSRDKAQCKVCGVEFAFHWENPHRKSRLSQRPELCLQCFREKRDQLLRDERLAQFRVDNPLMYHYLDQQGAPPRPAQYQAVLNWRDHDEECNRISLGLVLVGDSFTGKTTACYHLAHGAVERNDFSEFLAVNSTHLNSIPEKVLDRSIGAFMERLKSVELLLIDDLDKVRITPRVASELWGLFEDRLRHREFPILITMNTRTKRDFVRLFSGKDADSRQIGLSIYNRIRQACQFIDFDVETQPADPATSRTDGPGLHEPTAAGNPH